MPTPLERPQLPPKLLSSPAMISACRDRDCGAIFRLVRRAGLYNAQIGKLVDLSASRIGEVANGKRKILEMHVIERVADGLGIPGHMMGLARRDWETPPPAASVEPTTILPTPAEPITTLPGSDLDSILAVAAGPRLSPSTVRALHSSIEDYWRRDDEHGGETLRPAVVGQLRYVMQLIKEAGEGEYRRSLYGVAAELARLTGWTFFDARQYSQARIYFTEALQLAKVVDDRPFMANVLACMALQATYEDRPADAIALSTAAQDCARWHGATPRVMSMLSMREAFAQASMNNHSAAHNALADAHRHYERISAGDDDPAWVTYFDEAKLMVDTGIARGRLGEADAAEPLVADALRRGHSGNQRGRAFHSFWLATIQLQRGNVDQACHTAANALEIASAVDSERVKGHLREFHQQLQPYWGSPATAEFETRLRGALL
ncbi:MULTISPECIES: helix-turn-helix domain-containing protein [Streptomyces]|uniref:Helix-turn-helix domain-containing protein n=1 Tax=Streptomyces griseocarneus TaxID=51201 RepID=A0ABX7RK06_9ACTN|nr:MULTISPECIES: helix-turn-helix domain-containing protein [Streptomyces]QSY48112.1 helix-turn-helix domain-containing protein [Streptomyces griseocarneus]